MQSVALPHIALGSENQLVVQHVGGFVLEQRRAWVDMNSLPLRHLNRDENATVCSFLFKSKIFARVESRTHGEIMSLLVQFR